MDPSKFNIPSSMNSLAESLASKPEWQIRRFFKNLDEPSAEEFNYRWDFWARENQKEPPGDWTTWLILAGRGFGKTRTGAEWVR